MVSLAVYMYCSQAQLDHKHSLTVRLWFNSYAKLHVVFFQYLCHFQILRYAPLRASMSMPHPCRVYMTVCLMFGYRVFQQ